MTEPTIGRVVLYRVKAEDLERLANHDHGAPLPRPGQGLPLAKLHYVDPDWRFDGDYSKAVPKIDRLEWAGNIIRPGDVFPMVVVRPWFAPGQYAPGVSVLNGHVMLDGPGTLWALSVAEGTEPGTWSWPTKA